MIKFFSSQVKPNALNAIECCAPIECWIFLLLYFEARLFEKPRFSQIHYIHNKRIVMYNNSVLWTIGPFDQDLTGDQVNLFRTCSGKIMPELTWSVCISGSTLEVYDSCVLCGFRNVWSNQILPISGQFRNGNSCPCEFAKSRMDSTRFTHVNYQEYDILILMGRRDTVKFTDRIVVILLSFSSHIKFTQVRQFSELFTLPFITLSIIGNGLNLLSSPLRIDFIYPLGRIIEIINCVFLRC